ncbi:hypothetical protein ARTHRO9AX_10280 [Arthrobacter sp. 9AX]|nr:hypothetical protein ARTHRO9AX_10280 [Arthrobacter sp. 9AX]
MAVAVAPTAPVAAAVLAVAVLDGEAVDEQAARAKRPMTGRLPKSVRRDNEGAFEVVMQTKLWTSAVRQLSENCEPPVNIMHRMAQSQGTVDTVLCFPGVPNGLTGTDATAAVGR